MCACAGLSPGSRPVPCHLQPFCRSWPLPWLLLSPLLRNSADNCLDLICPLFEGWILFPHPHYLMVGLPFQVIWAPKLYLHVHFLVQFQILSLFEPLRSVFLVLAAQESQMEEMKKNTRTWCLPRPFKTNSLGMGAGLLYILKAPLLI